MKKIINSFLVIFLITSLVTSCRNDDEAGYVPLVIETQPDSAEVFSNQSVDISIFTNDINVPEDGRLTFTQPLLGSVDLIDNNTTGTIKDDFLNYQPDILSLGRDTFTYTICNELGGGCQTETVTITVSLFSPVVLNLADFPYDNLSDYEFFKGKLSNLEPSAGLVEVEPISQLFTDYALKKRFIYIAQGEKAQYVSDDKALDFPTGSALIKVFYYNNVLPNNTTRIIETRLMVKKATGWEFAEYVWNNEQTDAALEATGDGGFTKVNWLQDGQERFVNYRIPAATQCIICHKNAEVSIPIGISPKSLNSHFNYPEGSKNQLQKLIEVGYLKNNLPAVINTVVDWEDNNASLEDRTRSYLDINCANCHKDGGQGDYRQIRLSYEDTENNLKNLGVCVDADTAIPGFSGEKLIAPGDAAASVLRYRMNVVESQYTMPQFGRSLPHDEGLNLLDEWINSLNQNCN